MNAEWSMNIDAEWYWALSSDTDHGVVVASSARDARPRSSVQCPASQGIFECLLVGRRVLSRLAKAVSLQSSLLYKTGKCCCSLTPCQACQTHHQPPATPTNLPSFPPNLDKPRTITPPPSPTPAAPPRPTPKPNHPHNLCLPYALTPHFLPSSSLFHPIPSHAMRCDAPAHAKSDIQPQRSHGIYF